MIVHRYRDGSEGYEYELGDVVRIKGVMSGDAWFKRSIGRTGPVVEIKADKRGERDRVLDSYYVRDLPGWGPAWCASWQLEPTPETKTTRVIDVARD